VTGAWSKKALEEGQKYTKANVAAKVQVVTGVLMPKCWCDSNMKAAAQTGIKQCVKVW
jgi:hypothetical protein